VSVNRDKPDRWKTDIARSVDMYNEWFIKFAPKAFRETRVQTTKDVKNTLEATDNLTDIRPEVLRRNPGALPTLRMSTCPPLARDRLVGLTGVSKNMVERMERKHRLPVRLASAKLDTELQKIGALIESALAQQLKDDPKSLRVVWQALNEIPAETLIGEGRVYGGGLHKIEPGELANAPADSVIAILPRVSDTLGTQLSFIDCIA